MPDAEEISTEHKEPTERDDYGSTPTPLNPSNVDTMFFSLALFAFAAAPVIFGQPPAVRTDVPFVPTPPKLVDAMLALADVKPGDVLIDLGSGDGRIVIAAAQKYGIRAIGIEIVPELVRESEKSAQELGVADKVRFINGDLFGQDLRQASIVTVFLTPGVNLRLRPKLLKELKPGARVVSRTFNMGAWAPSKTLQVDNDRVYLWVIPDETPRAK
jgi:precorrin-6B methylase 2